MTTSVLIRGAGDLASGVALRLHRAGIHILMTELAQPLAVRRTVVFAEAIYTGAATVEGVTARRIKDPIDLPAILNCLAARQIPVVIDPHCTAAECVQPLVIVDARMAKQPPEPLKHSAFLHIGLGPGFTAPVDCHAVIETARGHTLGRVIWEGTAQEDSMQPDGDARRVLRAPTAGLFESTAHIGQHFEPGEIIGSVAGEEILAPFSGTLRGLLRPGLQVQKNLKIGDIDARDDPDLCDLVSDKSLAVGGAVLEAILAIPQVRSMLWA